MNSARKVVITGGPCCGKSTLVELLAQKGYTTVPEAAREIIAEEEAKKSDCVPWKKLAEFQYKNLLRLLAYEERAGDGLAFCDRGIGDSIAFCRDGNVEAPLEAFLLGKNRYDKIFIPDMLPNYKNDACRKETEAKAKSLHQQIYQAYIDLGYSPIRVPISSPEERAQFVLDNLSQSKPKQYYQKCISVYRSIVNKVMGE